MSSLKLEDWDLVNHETFPHLETRNLMKPKQNTTAGVTELEPWKWLHRVEKAGLLNLLWVSHFHCTPITIFIIRQLLCLMHDGHLRLKEPIPITTEIIHMISKLPCKGKDPMEIADKNACRGHEEEVQIGKEEEGLCNQ